jgi:Recombination, repair and ssDNA binding protein UvsY
MTLEEIYDNWNTDSHIDRTDLGVEALKIPKLHSKYTAIISKERVRLYMLEQEMKVLKKDKYEFYTQGPSKESKDKGWDFPSKGLILKNEVQIYIDSDKDIIDLSLRIGNQKEKIDVIEEILKSINNRTFAIKNAIDYFRLMSGG